MPGQSPQHGPVPDVPVSEKTKALPETGSAGRSVPVLRTDPPARFAVWSPASPPQPKQSLFVSDTPVGRPEAVFPGHKPFRQQLQPPADLFPRFLPHTVKQPFLWKTASETDPPWTGHAKSEKIRTATEKTAETAEAPPLSPP